VWAAPGLFDLWGYKNWLPRAAPPARAYLGIILRGQSEDSDGVGAKPVWRVLMGSIAPPKGHDGFVGID
jgi:hypothetical protein